MSKTLRPKKIEKEDEKNELIVQHNNLIEARYHLTLQEKRLMCWLASQVKITDEDFKEHTLSIREFADLIDVKGDHLYKALDDITTRLMKKIITIREIDKKSFARSALLGGAKYHAKKATIKLSFHPYLKPYMLQLKERFTQISLGDILGLKSVHSIRIYELAKQYEMIGNRNIPLQDLKEFCGIMKTQYKRYNDLKKDILERAKQEINEKTDLNIDYQEIKESRKVVAIEWTIKKKNLSEYNQADSALLAKAQKEYRSDLALLESLLEYGFSKPTARRLLKNNEDSVIQNALRAVNLQIERGNVKNPKAMLQTAIKEHWHPEKFQIKKKAA